MKETRWESCLCCQNTELLLVPARGVGGGVTSDCKPWPEAADLMVCGQCGLVQKAVNLQWRDQTQQIYQDYTIYHLSDGREQKVFTDDSAGISRSQTVLERLGKEVGLAENGRLLDVGCGNGSLLRSFASLRPGWRMYGHELGEACRDTVLGIEGVHGFFSSELSKIDSEFDLITVMHVLEHVDDPAGFLRDLLGKLSATGRLLVQVPSWWANPFDLLVVDHCNHFSPAVLMLLVRGLMAEVMVLSDQWVPKEITLVLSPGARASAADCGDDWEECQDAGLTAKRLASMMDWLAGMRSRVSSLGKGQPVGIFGTALAGTWLGSQAAREGEVFFVDEDQNRVGKNYLSAPVMHPSQVSPNASVFLAFPPVLAHRLASRLRLQYPGVEWIPTEDFLARKG